MGLDFLILYEHTVREYESDLLLKLELERRGYTAEIRQLLDRKKLGYFTWKKPKVLVASCMYDNEAINSHVYNNIGRCDRIVNLHWEQMLSDTQEEGDWFNMNGNAKKCVQTCWGRKTARRLEAHGMEEKNCPVTGAVMMDFLRPEFHGYFKDKAALCREFGLDPARPVVSYVSRMDADRALAARQLIEIAPRLDKAVPGVQLLIAGGGNVFDELNAKAAAVNEQMGRRCVVMTGPRTDINEIVAAGQVFVGVSRAALEAMSAGKPVIVAGNEGYHGLFGPDNNCTRAQIVTFLWKLYAGK